MDKVNINISMDENLKCQFDELCTDLGMSMAVAMNIFAKTAVREHRIPFELSLNVPNNETLMAIHEVNEMIDNGKGKKFNSVEELFEELNS